MEKAEIAPIGELRLLVYKKFPDGCRSRNAGLDPPTTKKGEPVTRVSAPFEPMLNTEISFELKSATNRNFPSTSVTNPRGPLASTGKGDPVTFFIANFLDNTISAFSIDAASGVLTPITGSPRCRLQHYWLHREIFLTDQSQPWRERCLQ